MTSTWLPCANAGAHAVSNSAIAAATAGAAAIRRRAAVGRGSCPGLSHLCSGDLRLSSLRADGKRPGHPRPTIPDRGVAARCSRPIMGAPPDGAEPLAAHQADEQCEDDGHVPEVLFLNHCHASPQVGDVVGQRRHGRSGVKAAAGVFGDALEERRTHRRVEVLAIVGRGADVCRVGAHRRAGARGRHANLVEPVLRRDERRAVLAVAIDDETHRHVTSLALRPCHRRRDVRIVEAWKPPSRTPAVTVNVSPASTRSRSTAAVTRSGTPSTSQRSSRRHSVSCVRSSAGTVACICHIHESCTGMARTLPAP